MENTLWPGAYSFKNELKTPHETRNKATDIILNKKKKEIEIILKKINELDKLTK